MKCLVACVFENSGVGKESGKSYSMGRCVVLTRFIEVDNPSFKSHGMGVNASELSVTMSFFPILKTEFARQYQGIPLLYDLETSLDREGKNIVVGFESSAQPIATMNPVKELDSSAASPLFPNKNRAAS